MEFSFHIPQTTRWIQWFRDSWNFCATEQKSHKSLFLNKPAMGNRIAATSCWISGIFGWWLMCRSERDRPSLDELSRFLDQNPRWSRLTCCRCSKLIRPPSPGQFQLGTDVSDYVLLQSKATNISLLISICCFVFFSDCSANLSVSPRALLIMGCFLLPRVKSLCIFLLLQSLSATFIRLLSWLWPNDSHWLWDLRMFLLTWDELI